MSRSEYDASEAMDPSTWQNRQGRENEWQAPANRERRGAPGGGIVRSVFIVAVLAYIGYVIAQAWGV